MVERCDYDGLQKEIRDMRLPVIDVWENRYPERDYTVSFQTPEFTCVCPKTGLPDFAHLYVDYSPREHCVELKSFKEYLLSFRDLGVFHEHAVNRILDDLVASSKPRWMKVRGVFNVRGGVTTTVEAVFREGHSREKV